MAKALATAKARPLQESSGDAPLIDALGATVKKMVAKGKEQGFVTYDDLNTALPPDQVSSEQIENTMSQLSEMGINVVENEEAEEAVNNQESADPEPTKVSGNVDESDLGRTDDPVRMYLRLSLIHI